MYLSNIREAWLLYLTLHTCHQMVMSKPNIPTILTFPKCNSDPNDYPAKPQIERVSN